METPSDLCYTAVRANSTSAESEQEKIRILIADDHPPFAQRLSKLLAEQPDLVPVGIATDGEEAVLKALKEGWLTLDSIC